MKPILTIKKEILCETVAEYKNLAKTNPKTQSLNISDLEEEIEQYHKLGLILKRMKSVFQINISSILFNFQDFQTFYSSLKQLSFKKVRICLHSYDDKMLELFSKYK